MDVGNNIKKGRSRWSFSDVAENFESHISLSIPFYNEVHNLITQYSGFFIKKKSNIYDLGCSTGNLLNKIQREYSDFDSVNFYGIDREKSMIQYAKKKYGNKIKFLNKEIHEHSFKKSNLIISCYTIQFSDLSIRQNIFDKIYSSLNYGGGFLIFEKVRAPDARFQDYSNLIYDEYKLENGFSEKNIVSKTLSLKGVLEPFSENGNLDLFKRSGFKDINTIFKWNCFQGWLLIK